MPARFSVTTEGARALSSNATKSMFELVGDVDVNAVLVELGMSFAGVVSTDTPVLVELYQITAGGTASNLTEVAWSRSGKTCNVVAKVFHTVEPTKTNRLAAWYVHPQGGNLLVQWPLGREPVISDGSTSQGLAVVYTTASGVTPNCTGYMVWEE